MTLRDACARSSSGGASRQSPARAVQCVVPWQSPGVCVCPGVLAAFASAVVDYSGQSHLTADTRLAADFEAWHASVGRESREAVDWLAGEEARVFGPGAGDSLRGVLVGVLGAPGGWRYRDDMPPEFDTGDAPGLLPFVQVERAPIGEAARLARWQDHISAPYWSDGRPLFLGGSRLDK